MHSKWFPHYTNTRNAHSRTLEGTCCSIARNGGPREMFNRMHLHLHLYGYISAAANEWANIGRWCHLYGCRCCLFLPVRSRCEHSPTTLNHQSHPAWRGTLRRSRECEQHKSLRVYQCVLVRSYAAAATRRAINRTSACLASELSLS